MSEWEVKVEGGVVLDQRRLQALAVVEHRLDRRHVVVAGSEDGNRDGPLPALEQRLQVVQEGVLAVRRVRDGLVAPEFLLGPDVVVEDPVVAAPLLGPGAHVLLLALESVPDALAETSGVGVRSQR